jgi:MFS family permease
MTPGGGPAAPPLPRAYWVVWAGTLVNRVGTFVEPFLVLYLTQERGLSPSQAGWVLAAYGVGSLPSQPIGGWLADHLGRRRTLLLATLAAAAALLLLGAARSSAAIAAASLLLGFFGDMYRPASSALVADVVAPDDRPRAYALLFWAINLGFSVAGVTAGLLASRGFGLLFVVDALTFAAFGVLVYVLIRRDPPRDRWGSPPAEPSGRGYGVVLRDGLMLRLCAITSLNAVVYIQGLIVLPLATTAAGLSLAAYGVIAATNGIVIVLVQPVVAARLRRHDRLRVAALSMVVLGVGFGLTAFADSLAGFIATVVVWTLGEVLLAGIPPALVADLAPSDARGRYQGVFGLSFSLAFVVAPLLGTTVYERSGDLLWAGCLVLALAAAAGFLSLRGPLAARSADSAA